MDLAPLRILCVERSAITKLIRCQLLGILSDAVLDKLPFDAEAGSIVSNAAQRNVNMRMVGVMVRCGDPL